VKVECTFPGTFHPKHIIAGEDVTTLLTVHNDHKEPVNVTYITGSLTSSLAFSVNIANFSVEAYHQAVAERSGRSFEYRFTTHERMPSRPFQITLTVFYETGAAKHASTFFNQTADILEPDSVIDTEALGLLATFVGIIAFISAPHELAPVHKRKEMIVTVLQAGKCAS
jgi:hypothetical protein